MIFSLQNWWDFNKNVHNQLNTRRFKQKRVFFVEKSYNICIKFQHRFYSVAFGKKVAHAWSYHILVKSAEKWLS